MFSRFLFPRLRGHHDFLLLSLLKGGSSTVTKVGWVGDKEVPMRKERDSPAPRPLGPRLPPASSREQRQSADAAGGCGAAGQGGGDPRQEQALGRETRQEGCYSEQEAAWK